MVGTSLIRLALSPLAAASAADPRRSNGLDMSRPDQILEPILDPFRRSWPGRLHRVVGRHRGHV